MANDVALLVPRFGFNDKLLLGETQGFTDADWSWRPPTGGNAALWILGHVTRYRRAIRRRLGEALPEASWEARYARGVSADGPLASSAAELVPDLLASGRALAERIPTLPAEALAAPFGSTFPDGATTLCGGLSFLYFHETYHLGQIGYLRRLLGKPGVA